MYIEKVINLWVQLMENGGKNKGVAFIILVSVLTIPTLSTYLPFLPVNLLTCLPLYLPTLPTYLPSYLSTYQLVSTYLAVCLPIYISIYNIYNEISSFLREVSKYYFAHCIYVGVGCICAWGNVCVWIQIVMLSIYRGLPDVGFSMPDCSLLALSQSYLGDLFVLRVSGFGAPLSSLYIWLEWLHPPLKFPQNRP